MWSRSAQRSGSRASIFAAIALLAAAGETNACTIFVLTDGERTLFFNNEDWSDPASRIWFVPAPEGFHSCAYVGFGNQGAEGGVNSEGLAFDWVAGFMESWEPYPEMKSVGGRTSERMLETCATLEEAIDFYRKHREPQFSRAKILIADRTGASAIIGAKDGKLQVQRSRESRGFGYGQATLEKSLKNTTVPELENGLKLLRACRQEGEYATKYSSVFNLNAGEILVSTPGSRELRLDLATELDKGAHYYDLPRVREQMSEPVRPLLSNMRRFLREFEPIPDQHPNLSARVNRVIRDAMFGKMQEADYLPAFWRLIEPHREAFRKELEPFGAFRGATLVALGEWHGLPIFRYKMDFAKAWVLQDFRFGPEEKVAAIEPCGIEWRRE